MFFLILIGNPKEKNVSVVVPIVLVLVLFLVLTVFVLVVLCLFFALIGNPEKKYVCNCPDCPSPYSSPSPIPCFDCFCLGCPRCPMFFPCLVGNPKEKKMCLWLSRFS